MNIAPAVNLITGQSVDDNIFPWSPKVHYIFMCRYITLASRQNWRAGVGTSVHSEYILEINY